MWQAGQRGPSLLLLPPRQPCRLHTWQARWLGATLRLLGKAPQTPLNDFCKIGCAPFRRFSENDTIRNTPATTGQGIGFASHSADLTDVRGRVFEQSRGAKPLYFYRA